MVYSFSKRVSSNVSISMNRERIVKTTAIIAILLTVSLLPGCVLTKAATVPMRVVGAAVSVVPVAGDAAHEIIDTAAEIIDDAPI
jgi:hypothetical protein